MYETALASLAPHKAMRSLQWFRENTATHEGKPYRDGQYPHIGAPGGPCDVLDDRSIWVIWLQWASRLGKTFFGQCALQFFSDMSPGPMMFASESQRLALDVVSRSYGMIEHNDILKGQLLPKHLRKQDRIVLSSCQIHVGWARSVGTLADKAVRFGHANEIDKWEHQTTSTEADPLKLFDDRFKEFPTHKKIKEGTPAVKRHSRVERGRLGSSNCQYFVPCPHCKKYQTLRMGATGEDGKFDSKQPGRIQFDKLPNGKTDKEVARKTACYICLHCEGEIFDEHRAWMMRRGVWVPEGCGVDHEKALTAAELWKAVGGDGADLLSVWRGWSSADWIIGEPARDGPDAGYQLSSLYALALRWGDIAAEFVDCLDNPQNLRNFVNQWLGETWEASKNQQTFEQLGKRIISTVAHGVVPAGFSLLTCAIDKQLDTYPYVVEAWGDGRKSHTIDYGIRQTLEEIFDDVLVLEYPHEDGGPKLTIIFTLIDTGFRPSGVYEFCSGCCAKGVNVWACKGASKPLDTTYRESTLGEKTSMPGAPLILVDGITTQDWIDRQLHSLMPADQGGCSLFAGSVGEHQDFLEQLLNDAAVFDLDSNNYAREKWQRINESTPNDYRDCRRYAYVAMLRATRGAPILPRTTVAKKPKRVMTQAVTRPDGRPFI